MPRLFSYVVDHDYGFAPNPFGGFCTLAKCKYGTKRRNIVEIAEVGDWIVGTGGVDLKKSAGHGKIIYAMRVDRKISLAEYCRTQKGRRIDAKHDVTVAGRYALISRHFFYFGRNAIDISEMPRCLRRRRLEKRGPGYRRHFSTEYIEDFVEWIEGTFQKGRHGPPCKPHQDLPPTKCRPKIKRKACRK